MRRTSRCFVEGNCGEQAQGDRGERGRGRGRGTGLGLRMANSETGARREIRTACHNKKHVLFFLSFFFLSFYSVIANQL